MRHYNKAGFSVKRIVCNSRFKSIMDIVSDDMGKLFNYENPYNYVTESEINNRVIKEMFRIAYY